jgi:hypothetical protein
MDTLKQKEAQLKASFCINKLFVIRHRFTPPKAKN